MIKNILSIRGAKVVHQDTGEVLAFLNWPIVDPDTGVIEAFWVKSLVEGRANAVILTSNILAFKKNIYIASEKIIMDPAEIIRIADILKDNRPILGANVQSESAKAYGKVYSLTFSTETYAMRQLYVQRGILGLFGFDRRIFPSERILKVLPGVILIEDDSAEKEGVAASVEPA